jgi:S-adenosylmethionine-diacylgycerolhomoserine-N-methlytransferase
MGYYGPSVTLRPAPDLVCFSHGLSMINPGVEEVLAAVSADLAPGGSLAVVDFHGTPNPWFPSWMKMNHVRMEERLLTLLNSRFHADPTDVGSAYGGLWQFFVFLGRPRPHERKEPAASVARAWLPATPVGASTAN